MDIVIGVMIVSSIFQATAVANVGGASGYPIPLFCVAEAIVVVGSIIYFHSRRGLYTVHSDNKRIVFTFFVLACTSIAVGSLVFSGTPVYSPRFGIDSQVAQQTLLRFSVSMIGQLLYLALNLIVYFCICGVRTINPLRIHTAIRVTACLLFVFAGWQIIHNTFDIYYPTSVVYSNVHGALGSSQRFGNSGIDRLSATFFEPSYFGLFCAALAAYFLMVARRVRSRDFGLHIVCTIGCVACTASTGLVALAVAYAVFGIVRVRRFSKKSLRHLTVMASVIAGCCLVAALAAYPYVRSVVVAQLVDKSDSLSYAHRTASNWFALELVGRTFGLGVGLGGNRPSSLALYLLSNVGVVGTAVFAYFLWQLIRGRVGKRDSQHFGDREFQLAARVALLTTVAGMCVSVPDLSLPQLWMWIFVVAATSRGHATRVALRADDVRRSLRHMSRSGTIEWKG